MNLERSFISTFYSVIILDMLRSDGMSNAHEAFFRDLFVQQFSMTETGPALRVNRRYLI